MSEVYTKPEWNSENRRFSCKQNGFGHWWPTMETRSSNGSWYPIIIRNSNPFKTLAGAIKFTESTIRRIRERDELDQEKKARELERYS